MPMRARFVSSLCLAMCGELVSRAQPGNVSVGMVQPAAGAVAGDDKLFQDDRATALRQRFYRAVAP